MNEVTIAEPNTNTQIATDNITPSVTRVTADPSRYHYGVGRRKASTARAKYYATGEPLTILINKKPIATYMYDFYAQVIHVAIQKIGISSGALHIFVKGGGVSGQAEAIRLAIAKSIVTFNPETKPAIRNLGYITTDTRKVLPKRPGLRKARKREQWSKR